MSPFVADSHPGDIVTPNGLSAPSMQEIHQLGMLLLHCGSFNDHIAFAMPL